MSHLLKTYTLHTYKLILFIFIVERIAESPVEAAVPFILVFHITERRLRQ